MPTNSHGGRLHYAWVVAGVTFLALLAASGVRSSFGVFIKPLERDFGWERGAIALAAAFSLLIYGAIGPFIGRLVDRYGPRRVLALSVLLCGAGALLSATVTRLWHLYLWAGIFTAVGAGGAAIVTASAIAARWFEQRRALMMGIAGAGTSAGQLLFIPLAMGLTLQLGWRQSFVWLGAILVFLVAPLTMWLLRDDPGEKGLRPYGAAAPAPAGRAAGAALAPERRTAVREAIRSADFWYLAGGFFVCGYTSNGMIGTHVVPYAVDRGLGEMTAAAAIGLMGAMNVVGTLASGYLCDRFGKKVPLACFYFFRGVSILYLITVDTPVSLNVWAVLFGLNYIATVPPTSTLTADLFGRFSVGVLFGWIFLSHQVGAAAGAWVGGWIFDATGSYALAFLSAAVLAFVAAGLSLLIREGRPARLAPEEAAAY
ncbi:MAG TPA: MFS transporter [Candidatus Methylomirabilis sp.]|nr:MFS transporter [Candidatus Methylomirabilis sp.]